VAGAGGFASAAFRSGESALAESDCAESNLAGPGLGLRQRAFAAASPFPSKVDSGEEWFAPPRPGKRIDHPRS
jgi:hypothetical protein